MNKIPRKPVGRRDTESPPESWDLLDGLIDDYLEPVPTVAQTHSTVPKEVIKQPSVAPNALYVHRQNSAPVPSVPPVLVPTPPELSTASTFPGRDTPTSSSSRWRTIVDETVVSSARIYFLLYFVYLTSVKTPFFGYSYVLETSSPLGYL